jgi:hypothetical protein
MILQVARPKSKRNEIKISNFYRNVSWRQEDVLNLRRKLEMVSSTRGLQDLRTMPASELPTRITSCNWVTSF